MASCTRCGGVFPDACGKSNRAGANQFSPCPTQPNQLVDLNISGVTETELYQRNKTRSLKVSLRAFSTAHRKQSCLFFPSWTTYQKIAVVPAATQQAMKKEDPVSESSETITLAGPETPAAPELSAPTVVGPFLLSIAQNLTSWS